ncbi:MAG: hypothetical protein MK132_05500 [Lentisphaerales bacterium]|nr:hypothetical protein [Lentisphaerales bacterium]
MFRKITFIFISIVTSFCFGQNNYHTERFLNLRLEFQVDKKDTDAQELINVVKFCQEKLNKHFIKVSPQTPKLYVFLEGNPPSKDFYNVVYFKRKELHHLNEYTILERILSKMMRRTIVGLGAPQSTKAPAWVIAAHVFNMRLYDTLSTEEKYPATRYSIVANKYPKLDELLTQSPPSPQSFWLYRLYSEYCSVFLSTLNQIPSGRSKLLAFLQKFKQEDCLALLTEHFTSLKSKTVRQRWFIKACTQVCFHILNPYPPEVIYQKVHDLFSIPAMRPGSRKTERIPLEELFEDEDEDINFAVISFIEQDFFKIFLTAPETLRPSLSLFIDALKDLKNDEREDFAEKIVLARNEFNKSVTHLKQLINYLNELEQSGERRKENYKYVLQVNELSKKRFDKYFSDWNFYLDSLESKLEKTVIE